jgi:ribosome-associated translation inhibitor RaiA
MGSRVDIDTAAKRTISAPVRNQTRVVQHAAVSDMYTCIQPIAYKYVKIINKHKRCTQQKQT